MILATIKVVVIDGQATMRERLRAALEGEPGITVVGEARDARKAAALLRKTKPDVVVMGLADPNGPDIDYCIWNEQVSARVLVLAAHAEPGYVLRALQSGAHGFLLRWASDKALIDAVRAVQAGGTFICGEASSSLVHAYVDLRSDMERTASKTG